jgi:hypothetical protein
MKAHIALLGALVCLLGAAVHAETIDAPLNKREIVQLVKGNTAEGEKSRHQINYEFVTKSIPFHTYFAPDGRLVERDRGGGSSQAIDAKGSWWVKKGKLCFQFLNSLRDTGKKCRLIFPLGDGAYELRSVKGEITHTWDRIVPGNPLDLAP